MHRTQGMDQDNILSKFLSHLEAALVKSNMLKHDNTYPLTVFMQAEDEDDINFFENLLSLRDRICILNPYDTIANQEHCFDYSNKSFKSIRRCQSCFLSSFQIHDIRSNEFRGRVGTIAVTIPAMANNGLLCCYTNTSDNSNEMNEIDAAVRVKENVDFDDFSMLNELYGDSAEYEREDILCQNYPQREDFPLAWKLTSSEDDLISLMPAYLARLKSRNAMRRVHTSSYFTPESTLSTFNKCRVQIPMSDNDEEDFGLFGDYYGDCAANCVSYTVPKCTFDHQHDSPISASNSDVAQHDYSDKCERRAINKSIISAKTRKPSNVCLYLKKRFSCVRGRRCFVGRLMTRDNRFTLVMKRRDQV